MVVGNPFLPYHHLRGSPKTVAGRKVGSHPLNQTAAAAVAAAVVADNPCCLQTTAVLHTSADRQTAAAADCQTVAGHHAVVLIVLLFLLASVQSDSVMKSQSLSLLSVEQGGRG